MIFISSEKYLCTLALWVFNYVFTDPDFSDI